MQVFLDPCGKKILDEWQLERAAPNNYIASMSRATYRSAPRETSPRHRRAAATTARSAVHHLASEEIRPMTNTFLEKLHTGYSQTIELEGSPIVEEKSQFQNIRIFDSKRNGRVLVLDDIVQLTTRDECHRARARDRCACCQRS